MEKEKKKVFRETDDQQAWHFNKGGGPHAPANGGGAFQWTQQITGNSAGQLKCRS